MVVVGGGGGHLRTVGTRGEGPGEIRNAHAAALLADGRMACEVIAGLAVDREDRLWIARMGSGGDETSGTTDVVAANGEYIGTLPADGPRSPAAFGPGGLMAYIESDEMDVQTVRVIRLLSLDRR